MAVAVEYFCKMLRLRCLTGFWIRLSSWTTFNIISLNLHSCFKYNKWQRFAFPKIIFLINYLKWCETDHLALSCILMKKRWNTLLKYCRVKSAKLLKYAWPSFIITYEKYSDKSFSNLNGLSSDNQKVKNLKTTTKFT